MRAAATYVTTVNFLEYLIISCNSNNARLSKGHQQDATNSLMGFSLDRDIPAAAGMDSGGAVFYFTLDKPAPLEECTEMLSKVEGGCLLTTHAMTSQTTCSACSTVSEVTEPRNIFQVLRYEHDSSKQN